MKLWEKGIKTDQKIEKFTVGRDRELDIYLAPLDVIGSLAHIKMLHSIKLLTKDELDLLSKELRSIYKDAVEGNFQIEDGVEDVHSQVELLLTRRLGEVGKKIHSGRSRNDQVLLDMKLYIREEIKEIVYSANDLFDILISQSEKYKNILIPGYTHMQVAMPSSFGLWFGAYAESLADDLHLFYAAFKIANQNPLGSAAGYGSSFPLNRTMTTRLLGFETLNYNVVYAQMSRGKTEKWTAFALSSLAGTLGRLSADVCQYISQNFGFISLPDNLTTGSSIMPHKKNPDVFELVRAKSNKIQSLPNEIALIMANLPSGYHRDMQIIKESFIPALDEMKACLEILKMAVPKIEVRDNILDDPRYKYMFSVEAVNEEVLKGVPFRKAYQKVAKQIAEGTYKDVKTVYHTHEGSIGNLCNREISEKMKKAIASFGFEEVDAAIKSLVEES